MPTSFWAKTAGSSAGAAWHEYIETGNGLQAKCNSKWSRGPPSKKRRDTPPRLGTVCSDCTGTHKRGNSREPGMAEKAFELVASGKFLEEAGQEIGRGVTAVRLMVQQECARRGVAYEDLMSKNRSRIMKERWERRRNEPLPLAP